MRICFISFSAYPLFNVECKVAFGGAEVQLFNMAVELAKKDSMNIDFIVGDFGQADREIIYGVSLIKSVRVIDKSGTLKKIYSVFSQLLTFWKSNADVFVQRSAGLQTGLLAIYCCIFRKKFVYMAAHDWDCNGDYIDNNGFVGKVYRFGLKNASLILVQSEGQKENLKRLFYLDSEVLKSGYPIPNHDSPCAKEKFILWVARLTRWKQPEVFLNLARKFPKIHFVMIAPNSGDECYSNEMRIQAEKIENLSFIQGLPFEETAEYFTRAMVFINTSKFEGFPNTFIQAMMNAVPILSLCVNPDNIINKNNIGIFAENDMQKLIDGCKKLLENKPFYDIVSSNAYRYARNNHDIVAIGKQLESILNK